MCAISIAVIIDEIVNIFITSYSSVPVKISVWDILFEKNKSSYHTYPEKCHGSNGHGSGSTTALNGMHGYLNRV